MLIAKEDKFIGLVSAPLRLKSCMLIIRRSPARGWYEVESGSCFSTEHTSSFFHFRPYSKGPILVVDPKDLKDNFIIQNIADDMVEMVPLDVVVVGNPSKGKGDLTLQQTNEDQDGFQRAFKFYDGGAAAIWPNGTLFYAQYLSV